MTFREAIENDSHDITNSIVMSTTRSSVSTASKRRRTPRISLKKIFSSIGSKKSKDVLETKTDITSTPSRDVIIEDQEDEIEILGSNIEGHDIKLKNSPNMMVKNPEMPALTRINSNMVLAKNAPDKTLFTPELAPGPAKQNTPKLPLEPKVAKNTELESTPTKDNNDLDVKADEVSTRDVDETLSSQVIGADKSSETGPEQALKKSNSTKEPTEPEDTENSSVLGSPLKDVSFQKSQKSAIVLKTKKGKESASVALRKTKSSIPYSTKNESITSAINSQTKASIPLKTKISMNDEEQNVSAKPIELVKTKSCPPICKPKIDSKDSNKTIAIIEESALTNSCEDLDKCDPKYSNTDLMEEPRKSIPLNKSPSSPLKKMHQKGTVALSKTQSALPSMSSSQKSGTTNPTPCEPIPLSKSASSFIGKKNQNDASKPVALFNTIKSGTTNPTPCEPIPLSKSTSSFMGKKKRKDASKPVSLAKTKSALPPMSSKRKCDISNPTPCEPIPLSKSTSSFIGKKNQNDASKPVALSNTIKSGTTNPTLCEPIPLSKSTSSFMGKKKRKEASKPISLAKTKSALPPMSTNRISGNNHPTQSTHYEPIPLRMALSSYLEKKKQKEVSKLVSIAETKTMASNQESSMRKSPPRHEQNSARADTESTAITKVEDEPKNPEDVPKESITLRRSKSSFSVKRKKSASSKESPYALKSTQSAMSTISKSCSKYQTRNSALIIDQKLVERYKIAEDDDIIEPDVATPKRGCSNLEPCSDSMAASVSESASLKSKSTGAQDNLLTLSPGSTSATSSPSATSNSSSKSIAASSKVSANDPKSDVSKTSNKKKNKARMHKCIVLVEEQIQNTTQRSDVVENSKSDLEEKQTLNTPIRGPNALSTVKSPASHDSPEHIFSTPKSVSAYKSPQKASVSFSPDTKDSHVKVATSRNITHAFAKAASFRTPQKRNSAKSKDLDTYSSPNSVIQPVTLGNGDTECIVMTARTRTTNYDPAVVDFTAMSPSMSRNSIRYTSPPHIKRQNSLTSNNSSHKSELVDDGDNYTIDDDMTECSDDTWETLESYSSLRLYKNVSKQKSKEQKQEAQDEAMDDFMDRLYLCAKNGGIVD